MTAVVHPSSPDQLGKTKGTVETGAIKVKVAAALLSAEITTPTNGTYSVPVTVRRDGEFTSDDLLLDPGTNTVRLIAQNANGLKATNTFPVLGSPIKLTATFSIDEFGAPPIYILGTVSEEGYTVWVNGTRADSASPDTDWIAQDIANPTGDNPLFAIRAIPRASNSGNGTGAPDATGNPTDPQAVDALLIGVKPPAIVIHGHVHVESWSDTQFQISTSGQSNYYSYVVSTLNHNWLNGGGGGGFDTFIDLDDIDHWKHFTNITWAVTNGGTAIHYRSNWLNGVGWLDQWTTNTVANPPAVPGRASLHVTNYYVALTNHTGFYVHDKVQVTGLSLQAGGRVNPVDDFKWVLLRVTAERVTQSGPWSAPVLSPIPFSDIRVGGIPVNAGATTNEGKIFIKVRFGTITNITPQIDVAKYPQYVFHVEILSHPRIVMSRAYHPDFTLPGNQVPLLRDLHKAFQGGTKLLAEDNDDKHPDNDPALTNSYYLSYLSKTVKTNWLLTLGDDAPAYVEFIIKDVPHTRRQGTSISGPFLDPEFRGHEFFEIRTYKNMTNLLWGTSAEINLVKEMDYYDNSSHQIPIGYARRLTNDEPRMAFAVQYLNNPSWKIPPNATVHEWLHTRGVWHREESNGAGVFPNPGPSDYSQVMCQSYASANGIKLHMRINRNERSYIPGQ